MAKVEGEYRVINGKKVRVLEAWRAHEGAQQEFCNSEEDEVLYGGGRGSAKTSSLIALALKYCPNPNYRGLILRRTFPQLLEIRDRCYQLYPKVDPGARFNKDDNRWEFSSGAAIQLGHVQHEEDKYRYQGFEFQFLGFDEVCHFTQSMYEFIKLSCRSKDPSLRPIVRATANPGGIGHQWVKSYFVDIAPPGQTHTEMTDDGRSTTRKYIKATVLDNPTLLENDPNYVTRLKSIPDERLRRMMLYGDWDAAEGLAFPTFNRDVHTAKLSEIFPEGRPPENMMVFASLDWGFSKPFSIHWHAVDNYDRVITFDEWYGVKKDPVKNSFVANTGVQMLARDVAKGFVQRSTGMKIQYLVADPSIKAKHGQESGSILQEFQLELGDAGIPVLLGNNDRRAGWMQMRSRLAAGPDGRPWWLITQNCVHLIRTISSMPSDPENPEEIPSSLEDHALDDNRYGLMSVPMKTMIVEAQNRAILGLESFRRGNRPQEPELGDLANTYH